MRASKSDLTEAAAELCDKTPAPMNTMVEKQPREEALQKKKLKGAAWRSRTSPQPHQVDKYKVMTTTQIDYFVFTLTVSVTGPRKE